jgi:signal transduction histidine kinase
MADGPLPPRCPPLADAAWAQHLHELRTPLTVVVARVQLLRRRLRRGEQARDLDRDLEAIESALARLTAAIERLDRDAGRG